MYKKQYYIALFLFNKLGKGRKNNYFTILITVFDDIINLHIHKV